MLGLLDGGVDLFGGDRGVQQGEKLLGRWVNLGTVVVDVLANRYSALLHHPKQEFDPQDSASHVILLHKGGDPM